MKKYIFIDIDGTLTNSNRKVSKENIEAIQKIEEKDFEIVFCSGRTNEYLINLSNICNTSRYLISSNGSMIYDQETKQILHQNKIPFDTLKEIYEYCKLNHMAITFNTEKNRYSNEHFEGKDTIKINNINELEDKNITQFVLGSYSYNEMTKVKDIIDNIPILKIVNISTTMKLKQIDSKYGFFYDIVLEGINKGTGINKFIELVNTTKTNCIAIGDHINDIDMFNSVGYKIAMGNACPELKLNANFITKTNDEDGVKYALEHIQKEFI